MILGVFGENASEFESRASSLLENLKRQRRNPVPVVGCIDQFFPSAPAPSDVSSSSSDVLDEDLAEAVNRPPSPVDSLKGLGAEVELVSLE